MALLVELSPQNPAKNLSSYFHTPQENTLAWIFAKPIPHNTLRYSTLYAVSRGESRVLLRRAKFVSPSLQGIHPRIPALGEKKNQKKKTKSSRGTFSSMGESGARTVRTSRSCHRQRCCDCAQPISPPCEATSIIHAEPAVPC